MYLIIAGLLEIGWPIGLNGLIKKSAGLKACAFFASN